MNFYALCTKVSNFYFGPKRITSGSFKSGGERENRKTARLLYFDKKTYTYVDDNIWPRQMDMTLLDVVNN